MFSSFLFTSLPKKNENACFALTSGYKDYAKPFTVDALFGSNALLGDVSPDEKNLSDFFRVPSSVYLCDEVTSTFAVAHDLAQNGLLPVWGAVLAAAQSEGRGQFRRLWQSPRGNLYVTFRLPDSPFFQNAAAALATSILFAHALRRIGCPVKIKWTNDLLNCNHEKVAGILIENKAGFLLAGVGINLCILPEVEQLRRDRAVSAGLLQFADGRRVNFSPFSLWQVLVNELIFAYSRLFVQFGKKALPELSDGFLAWKGETVSVTGNDGSVSVGKLSGISEKGSLLLLSRNGEMHEIFGGSLSLV